MSRLGHQGRIRGSPGNAKTAGSSQLAGRPKRNSEFPLAAQTLTLLKAEVPMRVPKAVRTFSTAPSHLAVILHTAGVA